MRTLGIALALLLAAATLFSAMGKLIGLAENEELLEEVGVDGLLGDLLPFIQITGAVAAIAGLLRWQRPGIAATLGLSFATPVQYCSTYAKSTAISSQPATASSRSQRRPSRHERQTSLETHWRDAQRFPGGCVAPELYRGGVGFFEQLRQSWAMSNSMLCVGLDPDPQRLPDGFGTSAGAVFAFCREIVDATADVVCAFKPQVAYFASQGAEDALERICAYIRESYPDVTLVLDSKRGDIGSTAEHYAREALVRYGAHAATVNPYMGADSIAPYLELGGGVIVVCRTSNASADVIQSMDTGGKPLYVRVAELVADRWAQLGDCGLVVGATYPDELRIVRDIVGDLPILVPGVGVQGGDPRAAVAAGSTSDGRGLLISASRSVIYASSGRDFAEAARREAIDTRLQALPAGW